MNRPDSPLQDYDFESSLGVWLVTTSHAYQQKFQHNLPEGITYRQCQTLGYLAMEGPLSQSELASRMMIEAATLSCVIDRMERDGWLRRVRCPEDGRRKIIEPTAAANPIWQEITACATRTRQQAALGLTPQESAQLKTLLEKVRTNLREDVKVGESA